MGIRKIQLSNFTIFDYTEIDFCEGINILIGENGTGKTHLMKVLYSACQAARKDISFSHKLVKVFKPDDSEIKRLANKKGRKTGNKASVKVSSNDLCISMEFSNQTRKWQADVQGEEAWEDQLTDLSSTFIPAKEILSNAWHLEAAVNKNNVDFDDTYVDIITSAKTNLRE
jgi:predicted ATP-binding protein involved in virulence